GFVSLGCSRFRPAGPRRARSRPAEVDRRDADLRQMLTMAPQAAGILAPALLEDQHLARALLGDDFARNRGTGNQRRTDGDAIVAADHQDFTEGDLLAGLAGQPVHFHYVVGGDPDLPAAGLDDCEHRSLLACSAGPRRAGFSARNSGFGEPLR